MRSAGSGKGQREWQSKVDPKSGRTYYYNVKTLVTTWTKPLELCTEEEKEEYYNERQQSLIFFRQMELNILAKFKEAKEDRDTSSNSSSKSSNSNSNINRESNRGSSSSNSRADSFEYSREAAVASTRRIRTISSIDDEILEILKYDEKVAMRQSEQRSRSNSRSFCAPNVGLASRGDSNNSNNSTGSNGSGNRYRESQSKTSSPIRMTSTLISELNLMADAKLSVRDSDIDVLKGSQYKGSSAKYDRKTDIKGMSSCLTSDAAADTKTNESCGTDGRRTSTRPMGRRRCNSTSTIYLDSTISTQDNESTMNCVCVVIRAHMIEGLSYDSLYSDVDDEFSVFNHDYVMDERDDTGLTVGSISNNKVDFKNIDDQSEMVKKTSVAAPVPPLNEIIEFFNSIFSRSQLEGECIIIALIYCERLVKNTRGRLRIHSNNWKSILFVCLVMASKVWDDLSMWNADFSQVCCMFTLKRVNALERAMLGALEYEIRVSSGEYAKYYFHLRSMTARLDYRNGVRRRNITPLDIKGAQRLQIATASFQKTHASGRRNSVGGEEEAYNKYNNSSEKEIISTSVGNDPSESRLINLGGGKVALERLLHEGHLDADGMEHVSKAQARGKKQ